MAKGLFVLLILVSALLEFAFANEADLQKAASLIESNQLEKARAILEDVVENDSNNANAQILLSNILLKENRISQALQLLEEKRDILDTLPAYYNNLAYAYFYKGKDQLAIDTLENGLSKNDTYNTLHNNLSTIYAFLAKKVYEKAIGEETKLQRELPQLRLVSQLSSPDIRQTTAKNLPQQADLNSERRAIERTLHGWATAWSKQMPKDYLEFYGDGFRTPAGVNLRTWKSYRGKRLKAPRFIEVKLSNFDIEISGDGLLASVHFLQHYRSNTLNDKVIKHVVMKKEASKWMIISENVTD